MADLQQDRIGGGEPGPFPKPNQDQHFDHVAVGYTNRTTLDDFIDGEGGDLVVRGPIHTGENVGELSTLGAGVTQGTPCLVVPLIHERMPEIQREVNAALDAFQSRWEPEQGEQNRGGQIQEYGARGESGERGGRGERSGLAAGERVGREPVRGANRGQRDTKRGEARAAAPGRKRTGTPTQERPRTYRDTGGTARGTSSGAIRKGSTGSDAD